MAWRISLNRLDGIAHRIHFRQGLVISMIALLVLIGVGVSALLVIDRMV